MLKICLLSIFIVMALSQNVPFNVWPAPASWTVGSTSSSVVKSTSFFSANSIGQQSDILTQAIARYTSIIFLGPPTSDMTVEKEYGQQGSITGCQINLLTSNEVLQLGFNESYKISVPTSGKATITAETVYGALRGLETFAQLVEYDWSGKFFINKLPITINDEPRYKHRGLLADTSRHYLPVDTLKQIIDGLAYNKYNTLHWHIVDDQSFPYVSTTYPKLSEKGAYNKDRAIYTPQDVQEIIKYGKYRGIRIMPEYDMPAHTSSWMKGYPALQGNAKCGFDPTLGTTYLFIENFLKEIRNVYTDNYIHLGGDELSFSCWETPQIQTWMKNNGIDTVNELEAYFEKKVLEIAKKLQIHPMVWQDIFNNGVKLAPEAVIEVWRGDDKRTMMDVVKAGYQATMSGFWYLDHLNDIWQTFYEQDISNMGNFTAAQEALIIGGEACMWGEHVDHTNWNERVWPRGSAVGEVLWSPKSFAKNWEIAINRLHVWKCRLNRRGIGAAPVGPGNFCNPLSTN